MDRLNEALVEFAKTQEVLGECLKKIVDTAQENQELMLKLKENKAGLEEFFDKYDEYHYQRWGGTFRSMFNKKLI